MSLHLTCVTFIYLFSLNTLAGGKKKENANDRMRKTWCKKIFAWLLFDEIASTFNWKYTAKKFVWSIRTCIRGLQATDSLRSGLMRGAWWMWIYIWPSSFNSRTKKYLLDRWKQYKLNEYLLSVFPAGNLLNVSVYFRQNLRYLK